MKREVALEEVARGRDHQWQARLLERLSKEIAAIQRQEEMATIVQGGCEDVDIFRVN